MVGAIDFLMKWQKVCKRGTCKNCELHRNGACITRLREMTQHEILKAIQVVRALEKQTEDKEQ